MTQEELDKLTEFCQDKLPINCPVVITFYDTERKEVNCIRNVGRMAAVQMLETMMKKLTTLHASDN